jgi:membrane protein implicated in regulation of membrane protease activity
MNPVLLWLMAGSCLCLTEAFFPTAFVALILGISAIAVAGLAIWIPSFGIQVTAWLLLATLLIIGSRRFVPKRNRSIHLQDAIEGETLTEILPGKVGRVLYEGNSWRAECQDQTLTLAPCQKVYVVGRNGNTLIVYPFLDTESVP